MRALLHRFKELLRHTGRDRRGAALMEFAVACPVFVTLLLGGVDLSRLLILNQKLDRIASGLGDLVAQADELTTTQMTQIFDATSHVAAPFDFTNEGAVVITSMSVSGGTPRINWQRTGGGSLSAASRIGSGTGSTVTLPSGMSVSGTETLIAAEVFFDFEPMFGLGLVPGARLYHRSFFRPRVGSLKTLG
jgi:Flp pilus assembly protein TadG